MSLLGKLAQSAYDAMVNYGQEEVERRAELNPMQSIFDGLQGEQELTLTDVAEAARSQGYSWDQIADWRGVNSHGLAVKVTPQDIECLQEGLSESGIPPREQPLLASGSDINWVFDPWETQSYVNYTLDAVDGLSVLDEAVFVSNGRMRSAVPELSDVQMNGFRFEEGAQGQTGNIVLSLNRSEARDGDISRHHNSRIQADTTDLSGLNAADTMNLALNIRCSKLLTGEDGVPANLNGVTLSPGSAIVGSEVDATFHQAKLGDIDLRNSVLRTPGMFQGAVFGNGTQLNGAIAAPDVFIGAVGPDGQSVTEQNVRAFMRAHDINDIQAYREAGTREHTASASSPTHTGSDIGAIATSNCDALINALCQAHEALAGKSGVIQAECDIEHANDVYEGVCAQHETNRFRVERESQLSV